MSSSSLTPSNKSSFGVFIESQFRTKPKPIPSTTSFAGQTILITGSSGGIGLAASQAMLEHKLSHLIMAIRTISKGEAAAAPLRRAFPDARIDLWALDMTSYESVQSFARRCATELPQLDAVVLNAGCTRQEFTRCNNANGHEEVFLVNYLSTALLASLLLPVLKANANTRLRPGRLTIVSSGLGLLSKFPNRDSIPLIPSFDDSNDWGTAAASERYSTSKTLVLMFVQKLGEINSPSDVIINAVDPGFVSGSGLQSKLSTPVRLAFGAVKAISGRSLMDGASTYVDAVALKGEETHGSFVMDWKIKP